MGTATISQPRPRISKVIKLSSIHKRRNSSKKSEALTEMQPTRLISKRPVIEKLASATSISTKPKKKSRKSNNSSLMGNGLLFDILAIFTINKSTILRTHSILEALSADRRKPWASICHGKPINARRLSSMLQPYGIHSRDLKFSSGTFKGFKKEWIIDALHLAMP
jgi:hypothetical protein